jgi:hypothetical protein
MFPGSPVVVILRTRQSIPATTIIALIVTARELSIGDILLKGKKSHQPNFVNYLLQELKMANMSFPRLH